MRRKDREDDDEGDECVRDDDDDDDDDMDGIVKVDAVEWVRPCDVVDDVTGDAMDSSSFLFFGDSIC